MTPYELKSWRQAQGLTQRELGDMLGVSNDTVSRWEKNRGRGRIPKLAEYAVKWMAATDVKLPPYKIQRTGNHRD